MKIGSQTHYKITFKSKLSGECREYIWAKTKKEAKEKFQKTFGKMTVTKIEEVIE